MKKIRALTKSAKRRGPIPYAGPLPPGVQVPGQLGGVRQAFEKALAAKPTGKPTDAPDKPTGKSILPEGLIAGIAGAGAGHALDGLLGSSTGLGSLLLAAVGKGLAGALQGVDPKAAESLSAMATGSAMTAMAKAAETFTRPEEPLVEEAAKAAKELTTRQHVPVQIDGVAVDPTALPPPAEPLVEEARRAVKTLRAGARR